MRMSLVLMIVAGLVLGACATGRPNGAASPRMQAPDTPLAKEMEALRRENDALKQEQLQNARQIEALQKHLAAQIEEQKRFREMMSTNFDLLEQSVALTLAKSIESGPVKPPAASVAKPPAAAPGKAPIAPPAPIATPAAKSGAKEVDAPQEAPRPARPVPAEAPKAIGKADQPWIVPLASESAAKGPITTAAAPAKTGTAPTVPPAAPSAAQRPAEIADPDLTPPRQPKTLTANRAAKALYERGFALYANRQYDQAILVYQNFLSRYPEDIYSDNAQFWIGESYLHLEKPTEAEAAYRKVLREYEHKNSLEGYKTPEAIYRLGTLAHKRGDTRRARYYFAHVAQRFPESSAGRKAQRELESLSKATAQSEPAEEQSGS
jgi:tol-pal system protein YbgF